MTYRISTVADVTGIPRNTLLAWERRYGLVRPTRHENGYRSYSDKDVALILRLRNAIAAGLRIGEAVELLRKDSKMDSTDRGAEAPEAGESTHIRSALLGALLEYRRDEAESVLAGIIRVPIDIRLREIYFPIIRQVSTLFAQRKITFAQEHYASTLLRAHWAALLVTTGSESASSPLAVTTTFTGDAQEPMAVLLALQLGASGFRVSYLGPSLAASELVRFAQKHRPSLACVACSSPPPEEDLSAYLSELASFPETRWILGGPLPSVAPPPGILLCDEWPALSPDEFKSGSIKP